MNTTAVDTRVKEALTAYMLACAVYHYNKRVDACNAAVAAMTEEQVFERAMLCLQVAPSHNDDE